MFQLIKRNLKGLALVCAVCAPLLMFLEAFMDLQQPTLMSEIVDVGIRDRNLGYVWSEGLRMVFCALAGFVGGAGCCVLSTVASVWMGGNMRKELFHKIQTLPCADIDRFQTSSLITRLTNDVMQLQNMMGMLLRVVRSPLLCLGGIVMSFLLSPRLAVCFCVVLPVIITCIAAVITKSVPLYTQMQQWLDKVNTRMRENLLGVRVVKTFNLEDRQNADFGKVNASFTAQSIRAQNLTFTLMPIVTLVMNLSMVAILWFGGRMAVFGGFETGKIMAFINYLVQITNSLMMLVNLILNFSRARASSARIGEVLACQAGIGEPRKPLLPHNHGIEFRNVSFRYGESGDYVLRNLSFRIREGETVGIIGATGSGKSSLVSLIPRLYETTAGQVLIGGCDVRDIPLAALRGGIGFVPQESVLFEGTIGENMRFSRGESNDAEIEEALRAAQAWDFIGAPPDGIESRVEQRGRNFSSGQKQRLAIARALLRRPGILILDDATSAVDFATEARLQIAIAEKTAGSTVIIVAQRISGIMEADTILMLDHGRLAAQGTHRQLLESSGLYRSIAVSQLGEEALTHAAE